MRILQPSTWPRPRGYANGVVARGEMVFLSGIIGWDEQQRLAKAVQLFGGMGVVSGVPVEGLYREIRALRIYEGASEVQKLVIARQLLSSVRSNT